MKGKKAKGVPVRPLKQSTGPEEASACKDGFDSGTQRIRQQKRKSVFKESQRTSGSRLHASKRKKFESHDNERTLVQGPKAAGSKPPPAHLPSGVVIAGRSLWASDVVAPSSYIESHELKIDTDSNHHMSKPRSKAGKRDKHAKRIPRQEGLQGQRRPYSSMMQKRVQAELLTSMLLRHLHRKFAILCAAEGLEGKQHASIFERWHFAARVEAETSSKYNEVDAHPCLPSVIGGSADSCLLNDLLQVAVSNEGSRRIVQGISKAVNLCRDFELHHKAEFCSVTVVADGVNSLRVSTECSIPLDSLKSLGCDEVHTVSPLRISQHHYEKLRSLFDRSSRELERFHADKKQQDEDFHIALFCLLERYRGIKGSGFQAALPGAVFVVLLQDFGACVECFASPLNCRYGRFCSGFFDCDVYFGSLGSFFRFCPRQGSFQANPPFVPQLIAAMTRHMHNLLARAEAAKHALSFVVIVGASASLKRSEAWQQLNGSDFLSRHFAIQLQHHRYKEGTQHMRKKKQVRLSSCDTSVFFLQTAAAMVQWPVTEEKLSRLKLAFQS